MKVPAKELGGSLTLGREGLFGLLHHRKPARSGFAEGWSIYPPCPIGVPVYGSRLLEQRCLFHKLRNVADKCREDLKGEQHQETRKQLLAEASAIYQAESAAGARERLCAFAQKGDEQAPKAVATLQRDFEQTIAFYALEGIPREIIRTTSLLERTNRQLRRKFRQACSFASQRGAEAALYLQAQRLNARWSKTKTTWWETSRSLFFDLLNLHP